MDGLVIRTVDGDWVSYNTSNSSLPENHVLSVIRGDESTIWVGTYSSGLVKLSLSQADLLAHQKTNVRIYPNPVQSGGSLSLEAAHAVTSVSISDVYGRVIAMETVHSTKVKMNAPIEPGMYVVHANFENQSVYATSLLVH